MTFPDFPSPASHLKRTKPFVLIYEPSSISSHMMWRFPIRQHLQQRCKSISHQWRRGELSLSSTSDETSTSTPCAHDFNPHAPIRSHHSTQSRNYIKATSQVLHSVSTSDDVLPICYDICSRFGRLRGHSICHNAHSFCNHWNLR